jgi:hypothetical protein
VVGGVGEITKSDKTRGAKLLFYGVFFLSLLGLRGREEILFYGLACPSPFEVERGSEKI